MTTFYFALTNPEADSLLKLEMATQYPDLKLSYSRPGFLTFKGGMKKVNFRPLMARVSGIGLGKMGLAELLQFPKLWVWPYQADLIIPGVLKEISDKSLFKVGETVKLAMMVGPNEFWVGEYELLRSHFQTPGEVSSILAKEVPSRAYYKMAEAYEAFDLDLTPDQRVLELGSSPGGASLFLLEQGMKVIGVDPAKMDQMIMGHKNFRHMAIPFEKLTAENVNEEIDWIISDINLPPTVVMKEIERLLEFLDPVGVLLTLKLNQDKHLASLPFYRQSFKKKGFDMVELKYLPSHRKEITLIAIHS